MTKSIQNNKSLQIRSYNERRVLQALRRMGTASKAEISRSLNLTNAAMGSIINSLEDKGLVAIGEKRQGERGQPARLICLNGDGAYSIGVQINRNKIETILIDFDGNIISRINHEMILPEPEETLKIVINDVNKILRLLDETKMEKLAGIGLAIPYNLDNWIDVLDLPKESFIKWKDFNFSKHLEKALNIPVYKANDGTSAAMAALYYGVGRDLNNFLYLYIGSGIGAGLVLDSEIVRGENSNAADVASMPVPQSRLESSVKTKKMFDILLNRASLNVLIKHLKYNGIEVHNNTQLESLVKSKNKFVEEWIDDSVEALTYVVLSSITLLDISTIIISSEIKGDLTKQMQKKLDQSLLQNAPELCSLPTIITGKIGSNAGTIGAASIPMFYCFSPSKEIFTDSFKKE